MHTLHLDSRLSAMPNFRGILFATHRAGPGRAAFRSPKVVRAQQNGSDEKPSAQPAEPKPRRRRRSSKQPQPEGFTLDDLNPISMGRKSRVLFDDVWTQLQRIGGPSRSVGTELIPFELDAPEAYESPKAADTTVLVAGATGRIGRVLVRKLLLRGYKVRALVRRRGENTETSLENIPQSVDVVFGDVGDYDACRAAVEGADKVIFCAAARTTVTADLNRVDDGGVVTLARAFQDAKNASSRRSKGSVVTDIAKIDIADFKNEVYHPFWDVEHVGPPEEELSKKGYYAETRRKALDRARDSAEAYVDETDNLVFEGAVYTRDGYAQVGASVKELPHKKSLAGTEGLIMRLLGDGHQYTAVVEAAQGVRYSCKFATRQGYSTIRLPWSSFLPGKGAQDGAPFDPTTVSRVSLRFEPKVRILEQVTRPGESMFDSSGHRFSLKMDWIKALPGGTETDFILVSCAGVHQAGEDDAQRERIVAAKRRGEGALRNSGLGYTIVRPGPLAEEAGGYKALVFDQGNRITEKVACADVADVCVKALHDPAARNKTFELCWEYTPEEGLESWDLLCHFPDKSTAYLSQALAPLQKNT